jgi:hypothetical protein
MKKATAKKAEEAPWVQLEVKQKWLTQMKKK